MLSKKKFLIFLHVTEGKKPKILTDLKDVKVASPKPVKLKCEIEPGEPAAKVTWYKEAKEIYSSRKYDMSYTGTQAVLEITSTEFQDGALYRCEASNRLGRVETEATVTVQGEKIVLSS